MDLLNYIKTEPLSSLVLDAALILFVFILIVYFFPTGKKSKEQNTTTVNKASTATNSNKHKKNEISKANESKKSFFSFSSKSPKKKLVRDRDFDSSNASNTSSNTSSNTNNTNDSGAFDFLKPATNESAPPFKHGKVTDYFKETVKHGPASNLKSPDFDDLDRLFTTMIKGGAISRRDYLVTNYEHQYLEKLRLWFGYKYYIYCQVSVGSVVNINAEVTELPLKDRRNFAQKCHNMSFDFMIIEKATDRIVAAVELDDPTHLRFDRQLRDRRLDKVCKAANIPIFHITNINQKPDISRL